jgi:thymidylate synthase (FAD)
MVPMNESYVIERIPNYEEMLETIERYARNCYKSESRMVTNLDMERFIRTKLLRLDDLYQVRACLKDNGLERFIPSLSFHDTHEGPLEHEFMTVRFICDRGISHELVRHRLSSFLQESTRYCCYGHESKGFSCIDPLDHFRSLESGSEWVEAMDDADRHYNKMIELGERPEMARSVLPHSTKVDIIATANIREWRLIFKLRSSNRAHPQMRDLMIPLLEDLKVRLPVFFEDICYSL